MSEYWGFRCLDCGEDADSYRWLNHGEESLAKALQAAPLLKDLLAIAESEIEIQWLGANHEWPNPPYWVIEHVGHDVVLRSEYGNMLRVAFDGTLVGCQQEVIRLDSVPEAERRNSRC